VKSEQLLTQGKIFEDDILAGPECTNNPAEEVPEPNDHAHVSQTNPRLLDGAAGDSDAVFASTLSVEGQLAAASSNHHVQQPPRAG
jgi:hypothetical protein